MMLPSKVSRSTIAAQRRGSVNVLVHPGVFAFEKASGRPVDGALTGADHTGLATAAPVVPRSTTGAVVEVDKSRQLLIVAHDGAARWMSNASTGTEQPYTHPTAGQLLATRRLTRARRRDRPRPA
jgi:hypothetical protein